MNIAELLKNSTINNIELHACCLLVLVFLYINMRNSRIRDQRKTGFSLTLVYISCALVLITDCLWTSLSNYQVLNEFAAYFINLVYFLAGALGVAAWYVFCTKYLDYEALHNKGLLILSLVPYFIVNVVYISSPWNGAIFSIVDGEYVRGMLFFLDPALKLGYLCVTAVLAIICGKRREQYYLKRKDFSLVFYSVPVIVFGILQAATGADFNCIGITIGLILIYVTGVTNTDLENIDTIYSLADSFEASYLVNMDSGEIRSLRQDNMHSSAFPEMQSMDYTTRFSGILTKVLLPEDREETLNAFKLENVAKRFKDEHSFTIRYRVKEESGQITLHMASFIHAVGRYGKQEFLIGVSSIQPESLLYGRNEALSRENMRLEEVNKNIILSVAKMVEARDFESGEHITRVMKLSEILAREIMNSYPEYGLTEEKVELITSASVLHDIGKIVIPDAVLLKPGRLTDEEFEIMKTHSAKGNDILNMFPLGLDDAFLGYANEICRWHHEKYDGKGYPDGLVGDDIPIAAQIVSVADCFDALVSDRPYKKAFSSDKAYEMILGGECGAFSPKLMDCFKKQKKAFSDLAEQNNVE